MVYKNIQPPFTLKFREMSKNDLVAWREWYHAVMPERLAELTRAVRDTVGFECWEANFTPDSLEPLGEWFYMHAETRRRTKEEMDKLRAEIPDWIDVPEESLTIRTLSLAMDIGMYFGQVFLKNVPGTRWGQPMKSPNDDDYGKPVIMGSGKVPLNPGTIALTLAYKYARREGARTDLRTLYDIWRKDLS